jgi:hypothetical protein
VVSQVGEGDRGCSVDLIGRRDDDGIGQLLSLYAAGYCQAVLPTVVRAT